jgi:hypothetical protein
MAKLNLEGIDDKELIQLVKMKIEKSKNVRDTNKAIVNNLKTQLNKTKLPKNINKNIAQKVDAKLLANATVASNLKKAQNVLKNELKALPKMKPNLIKVANIMKKDANIGTKKVKATAANTKDYNKTLALQKRLIRMGAKITADGIMGPRTRAAIQKFMKKKSASPIMSKRTSSIKTTPSKYGGRISMSARLKEIDDEKKRAKMKGLKRKIVTMAKAKRK